MSATIERSGLRAMVQERCGPAEDVLRPPISGFTARQGLRAGEDA